MIHIGVSNRGMYINIYIYISGLTGVYIYIYIYIGVNRGIYWEYILRSCWESWTGRVQGLGFKV